MIDGVMEASKQTIIEAKAVINRKGLSNPFFLIISESFTSMKSRQNRKSTENVTRLAYRITNLGSGSVLPICFPVGRNLVPGMAKQP